MKKTIERIVTFAAKVSEAERIILFGSMNNGTHNVHSDLDLLIVTEKKVLAQEIVEQIQLFVEELSLKADILVCSKGDIEGAVQMPNSFLAGVIQSGTTVYSKAD